MPFEFSVSDLIPASAQDIYDAWLSSSGHEKITGGQKAQISAQEGAAFTVWNGYITGRNLKLEPGRRIIQSWRTTKFTDADPDSQIEVLLQPAAGGTMVTAPCREFPFPKCRASHHPFDDRYAVSCATDACGGKIRGNCGASDAILEKAGRCSFSVTTTIGSPRFREGTRD